MPANGANFDPDRTAKVTMVLNLTRPMTSAVFPDIKTRREKSRYDAAYEEGHSDAHSKYSGMSREELKVEIKKARKDARGIIKRENELKNDMDRLDEMRNAIEDTERWAADFLVFEKPTGGVASLRQAFTQKKVLSIHEVLHRMPVQSFEEVFEEGEIFRVEHDWFKAIRKADEFEAGSFRLPYEVSIFEFQVSRRSVVAMCVNYAADAAENEIVMQLAVEGLVGWSLSHNLYRHNGGHWDVLQAGQSFKDDKLEHLVHLVGNQIRAACIALDAEVATTTLVRQAHSGVERDAKEYPAYEFYTINIASRSRAEALQASGAAKGTKRLHFRRGHWRHFTASKTWVRWCLVGNPELGFIDKQYRL